ncbi:MAG: DUF3817 domain-containing protein [Bacteroidia bacterium]|nr:DUF3817 domain-containing protein [Bacteroidia bacterium]
MMQTALGRFRVIGFIEGISYLVLLGIAMPLKYFAGIPEAVTVTGWMHGLLFVLYCAALAQVMWVRKWTLWKGIVAFIASLIPLGTFWLEPQLRREQEASEPVRA